MNRSAKGGVRSSPQYWGRRRSHSPTAPRCLRTAGTEEQPVTSGGLAGSPGSSGVSGPISESEVASKALSVVGQLNSTYEAWRKPRDRATGGRMGRERQLAKTVGRREKTR